MRRENSSLVVYQSDLGSLGLPWALVAAQLPDRLDDSEQPTSSTCMRMREHPPVRVDRKAPTETGMAFFIESTTFTALAESQFLELEDWHDRETVVELSDIDILRA